MSDTRNPMPADRPTLYDPAERRIRSFVTRAGRLSPLRQSGQSPEPERNEMCTWS